MTLSGEKTQLVLDSRGGWTSLMDPGGPECGACAVRSQRTVWASRRVLPRVAGCRSLLLDLVSCTDPALISTEIRYSTLIPSPGVAIRSPSPTQNTLTVRRHRPHTPTRSLSSILPVCTTPTSLYQPLPAQHRLMAGLRTSAHVLSFLSHISPSSTVLRESIAVTTSTRLT